MKHSKLRCLPIPIPNDCHLNHNPTCITCARCYTTIPQCIMPSCYRPKLCNTPYNRRLWTAHIALPKFNTARSTFVNHYYICYCACMSQYPCLLDALILNPRPLRFRIGLNLKAAVSDGACWKCCRCRFWLSWLESLAFESEWYFFITFSLYFC